MKEKITVIQKDTWASASEDQKEIKGGYERLKSALPASTSRHDLMKIDKAFQLALRAHAGIRRKSGEPYIMHPLRVALIVAKEIGLGPTSIVSAIIHDVVEDTTVSINKVHELFGLEVGKIVRGLTKIKKMLLWNESMQAENFKKLLLNASEDNRIILVKLADRLDNMRYLDALSRRKQLRIAAESQQIYAPVAHRLGLNRVKAELEDLYLKYTYPKVFYKIAKKLETTQRERAEGLASFSKVIKEALEKYKINFVIQHRVKSIYSIWKKIEEKKIPFEEIFDLVALRIIINCDQTDEKALCWQAYGIISDMYPSNTNRFHDWISTPKSNGYESLHVTVLGYAGNWVEIQIRTARMHEIAERGVAAHWEYKKDAALGEGAKRLEKWLHEVRRLLESGKSDSINLIEDFKLSLYDDEIMVVGKNGTSTLLPLGATVLDFAIEKFDERGLMCSGAMINKRYVPVNYVLKNAEKVDVILTKNQKVPQYWLDISKTAKGRRLLKQYFRRGYLNILQAGKEILKQALKEDGMSLNKNVEVLFRDLFGEKSVEKTYYRIGTEAISVNSLKKATSVLKDIKRSNTPINQHKPAQLKIEEDVVVTGADDPEYEFAKCCTPIPDEEIFALLRMDEPMQIHRVDCPRAPYILSTKGRKVVKARWKREEKTSFLVFLELKAANRRGMSKEVVNVIKTDVHIESLSFLEQDNYIRGNLSIEVENAAKLAKVTKAIEELQGVVYVQRVGS